MQDVDCGAGWRGGAVVATVVGLAGCAAAPPTAKMQSLDLDVVTPAGVAIGSAQCTLRNGEGEWTASAPGRVALMTGAGALTVHCRSGDGALRGESSVQASESGGRGMRALVGAGAGAGIGALVGADSSSGYCCGRGVGAAFGALAGGLLGGGLGMASARPTYEYPAKVRVVLRADAPR